MKVKEINGVPSSLIWEIAVFVDPSPLNQIKIEVIYTFLNNNGFFMNDGYSIISKKFLSNLHVHAGAVCLTICSLQMMQSVLLL